MNHLRKQILFLCDSLILIVFSTFFSWFSLRYDLTDAVGQSVQLIQNFALLYACTVLFQLLFRTYDSLWRYAESKEYLSLLMAAFCGFFLYEVLSRIFLQSIISFMLLTCVASLWVLGMLLLRFAYRVYRSQVLFSKGSHQIPVAIVGAGAAGVQLLDEHLQLLLTFLARMRIHIPRVLFAVDPCRGVAPFKEVVIDLADAARAGLADLAHVGLKINDGGCICLRRRLVRKFCFADAAVDLPRGGVLHLRGRVRVNIQRRGRRHMSQHGGECFHVHPILQRQGRT